MSGNAILELFGVGVGQGARGRWTVMARKQHCPFLGRKCLKVRKSQPGVSIGSCSVRYGKEARQLLICPHRFLERRQVFTDCLQLLALHEPGNEIHLVPEVAVPGGSVDYFLVSARGGKVKDFVAVELQTLDTTGTLWPARQRFLQEQGDLKHAAGARSRKTFGINWKMTAKTILVQIHHKIETFEHIGKHLVLVIQDHLLDYMTRQFNLSHLQPPSLGNSFQVHAYQLTESKGSWRLELVRRQSTDAAGVAAFLGLQISPKVELSVIVAELERKLSPKTLFNIAKSNPAAAKPLPTE